MIQIQWEGKDICESFSDEDANVTEWIDTGESNVYSFEQHVTSASTGPKKWRVRVLTDDPLFGPSPWYTLTDNGLGEADITIAN